MMVQSARCHWKLLLLWGVLSVNTASAEVAISNNFSTWTSSGLTFVNTNRTDGWSGNSVRIGPRQLPTFTIFPPHGTGCFFNSIGSSTNSWLQMPMLSNGVGRISVVGLPTTVTSWSGFDFQASSNGIDRWVTLTNVVFPLAGGIWTNYDIVINNYTPTFFRFLKTSDNGGASYYCFDQVIVHHPPTRVAITNVTLDPSPAYSNSSFNLIARIPTLGIISNLTVTNFYRIGTSGPWTALGMASNGTDSWITTNFIPGQLSGTTIQYVVTAYFQGPDAMSPTSYPTAGTSAPLSFVVKSYPRSDYLPTSMSVFGALSTNMILVSDYTWEAFLESAEPLINAGVRWQGVPNHDPNTTNTWGENDQTDFLLRLDGLAEAGGGDVILPGTNSGQFVMTFNEISGAYTINHGYWENFDAWDYTTTHRAGWESTGGAILMDPTRILRNNSLLLGPGSNVRSPFLETGIGEIVFAYRNYQPSGLPSASLRIQKSTSGSTQDADWTPLTNIFTITTTDYARVAFTIEDRNSRYVRIQNSSTNGWVALDEIQIYDPYYSGVMISNLTLLPPTQTATNPVTVLLDIQPFSGAADIQATLFYRVGGDTSYSAIALTNTSGFTYTTVTPIPANLVPDYWGYRVEYYIRCTFAGDQSNLTSPVDVPAGGSNNPAFYVIESDVARISLHDLFQTYNGSNRIVTATTYPTGLVVDITYDGELAAPVNAGSYAIVATVNDAEFQGTQLGTLTVAKADQTIMFPNQGAQVTTNTVVLTATAGSGLPVSFQVLSEPGVLAGGSDLTFTGTGSVAIVAHQDGNSNWNPAAPITNILIVTKAMAVVTLNNLTQMYNGSNRIVTASTIPAGLIVNITYDGNVAAPVNAGSYVVVATVNDTMYQGSQTKTLVVTINDMSAFFRIVSSTTTVITALSTDGVLVWSNAAVGGTGSIQWAMTLMEGSNWMNFAGYTVTGTLMAFRLFDSIPPSGMLLIPAGNNSGVDPDFGAYSLTVSDLFMDRTEVTKATWDEVYTWAVSHGYNFYNAGSGKAANHPVHTVNWFDVVKWCNARSEKEGRPVCYRVDGSIYRSGQSNSVTCAMNIPGYRLPTEVEWQYAARGGAEDQRFPWRDTDEIQHARANYYSSISYAYDTSPTRGYHPSYTNGVTPYTSPSGSFAPNDYGLYDMAGNVGEWCWDAVGSRRVIHDGSWYDRAFNCRIGYHYNSYPYDAFSYLGFRVVRSLGQ